MKKSILSILAAGVLIAGGAWRSAAQDVHFSQFYESTILRNPALTGIFTGEYKVTAIYRNQWSSVSQPFQTALISAETRIPVSEDIHDFVSIGLVAYYDRAGSIDLKTMGVYPAINYNKSLEDDHNSFISVGFTGGYLQRSFDPTKMTFDNQYQGGSFNPDNPTGEQITDSKIHHWDLGAGISFSSSAGANNDLSYFVGVAGYHFLKPTVSFFHNSDIKLEMKWNVNAGINYKLSERYGLILHANYMKQGSYSETIGGGLLSWKNSAVPEDNIFTLYAGAFYRINDALAPTVKLDYKTLSFGLSYDVNISKLKAASNLRGGYELTVVKTGLFKDPRWEKARTICPSF
jgi:type IX secretion system PorP/SprF family membrane protein